MKLEISRAILSTLFQNGSVAARVVAAGSEEGCAVVHRLVCNNPTRSGSVVPACVHAVVLEKRTTGRVFRCSRGDVKYTKEEVLQRDATITSHHITYN